MHYAFTEYFIIVGFLSLAFFYLLIGTQNRAQFPKKLKAFPDITMNTWEGLALLVSGEGVAVSMIGILFYFLNWEGSGIMLMVGGLAGLMGLLAQVLYLRLRQPEIYTFFVYRLITITVICGYLLYKSGVIFN